MRRSFGERGVIGGITICNPWAKLIAMGEKGTENRDWIPALDVGSYLAIHAGGYDRRKARAHWSEAAALYERRIRGRKRIDLLDGLLALPPWSDTRARGPREEYAKSSATYGAIVAVARYGGAVREPIKTGGIADPWFTGTWGWCLMDVVPLETPVPCAGQLSVWNLSDDVLAEVRRQYTAARDKAPAADATALARRQTTGGTRW